MTRLEFGSNNYSFFEVGRRAGPHYSTGRYSKCTTVHPWTVPTPPNPKLAPLPVPPPLVAVDQKNREGEGAGEEEKRREGRLGHAAVHRRRSSSKTGRDSVPLLVFSQFGSLPRCSLLFPHVCCSLGAIEVLPWPLPPRKPWGIVHWIVTVAIAFDLFKGKP